MTSSIDDNLKFRFVSFSRWRIAIIAAFCSMLTFGCQALENSSTAVDKYFRNSSKATSESLDEVLSWRQQGPSDAFEWNWMNAIPSSVDRADRVHCVVPLSKIKEITGQEFEWDSVTASDDEAAARLVSVQQTSIRNIDNLNQLLERLGSERPTHFRVPVEFENEQQKSVNGDRPRQPMEISIGELAAIAHASQPNGSKLSQSIEGNHWVYARKDGLSCRVLVRIERTTGLIQLVLTGSQLWGNATTFPYDVSVMCDDTPAVCRSVSETLESLYGERSRKEHVSTSAKPNNWRTRSDEADFLIPTNYKKLNERLVEIEKGRTSKIQTAFAEIPGIGYPGPSVLGDARALSMFMINQTELQPGDGLETGWIIFQSDQACDACELEIEIQLSADQPPQKFAFMLPPP